MKLTRKLSERSMAPMASLKFPRPSPSSRKTQMVWRSKTEIVKLAKAANKKLGSSLARGIRKWVRSEATKSGWDKVIFPYEFASDSRAGAVFIRNKPQRLRRGPNP